MDETRYQQLVDAAYRKIVDLFEDVDPDAADCAQAGDVITITFRDKRRCIINTQRPTRQIWVAANSRAWHVSYNETSNAWLDDKGQGELFGILSVIVKESAGITLS